MKTRVQETGGQYSFEAPCISVALVTRSGNRSATVLKTLVGSDCGESPCATASFERRSKGAPVPEAIFADYSAYPLTPNGGLYLSNWSLSKNVAAYGICANPYNVVDEREAHYEFNERAGDRLGRMSRSSTAYDGIPDGSPFDRALMSRLMKEAELEEW